NALVRLKHPTNQIIVQADGQQIGTFDATAVSTIEFQGFAGRDHVVIGPKITATTILDGGAGNDQLFGGDGSNILLGGPGDDLLMGGSRRDILIGGDGRDHLQGHKGDDILIGGSTAYDANTAALLQILAAWNSSDPFNVRVSNLQTGAGDVP